MATTNVQNIDFTPIENMKAHLVDCDSKEFDRCHLTKGTEPLWFVNAIQSANAVLLTPSGEDDINHITVKIVDEAEEALAGYVRGSYVIRKSCLADYAPTHDEIQLPTWTIQHTPYLLANFPISLHVEIYELWRAHNKPMPSKERGAFSCNVLNKFVVFAQFVATIDTLRQHVSLALKSVPHIDEICESKPLVEKMREYGMVAPPVLAAVDTHPQAAIAINERKAVMTDQAIAELHAKNKKDRHKDFTAKTAKAAGISVKQVNNIVRKTELENAKPKPEKNWLNK
jgi:hypothetical protein